MTLFTQDSYAGNLLDALSQNRYTYAEDDPVNYTDPSGHAIRTTPVRMTDTHGGGGEAPTKVVSKKAVQVSAKQQTSKKTTKPAVYTVEEHNLEPFDILKNTNNIDAKHNTSKNKYKNWLCDQYSDKIVFENGDISAITIKPGKNDQAPQWVYDNYFSYDPNAIMSKKDFASLRKWITIYSVSSLFGKRGASLEKIPDGLAVYEHYLLGKGEDYRIDYSKAYKEDSIIKDMVDKTIVRTTKIINTMVQDGLSGEQSFTSEMISYPINPKTENWQKTIGRHQVWLNADVDVVDTNTIKMKIEVNMIDRYNFNKNDNDIASGRSDNENGRFEELGIAHSFTTHGNIGFKVAWNPGGRYLYISNNDE